MKKKQKKKNAVLKLGSRESLNFLKSDILGALKEILTRKKNITENNEIFQEIYRFEESDEQKHSKYSRMEKVSFISLGLLILNILTLIICYGYGYMGLKSIILTNSVLYIALGSIAPFIIWILSTNENFWAFHQRKRVHFYLCCINLFLIIMQPVYSIIRRIILSLVLRIRPDEMLTVKMLMLLAYIGILFVLGATCVILYTQIEPLIMSKTLRRQIELFKLSHVVDEREDRDYKYDINTVKDLETGNSITVKERDRMNQMEINGASGTGKTSSIFLPVIEKDADQKVKNREKRQEELLKLINSGKATLKGPLKEFKESAVIPLGKTKAEEERNKKAISKILKKYADCGMTIIAPNASLVIEIIKIMRARGIKVNVLDPMGNYSMYDNAKTVGINPFYVPLGLSEEERVIYISQAATVFAEVLIATNQMNGAASDVYFTDISLSVSSNIAAVVMLAKNITGQQAYIDDVQNCISNFENIRPYMQVIEKHYGINILSSIVQSNKNAKIEPDEYAERKETLAKGRTGDLMKNPYYQQLLFVAQELLGSGSADMFSQARGLRNLINKVLQDTRIKTKLSEKGEGRIDFDQILSDNEITVVNTAIELGKSSSTAFGLFFILLHKVSVLRRPMETRTPHFLWIDEASQYMHPCYEDMISLYRQYSVAVVITLQSLTQTEKSSATAYLKNVFLGAGTHIVFGRLSAEEMKLYSEMGGIIRENVEQRSYTASSIFTSDPGYTESVRNTPTITNVLEGSDLRLLDFQELTIFTINNGRVLPGQLARVFFIKEEAYDMRNFRTILWERVVPEAFREDAPDPTSDEEESKRKLFYKANDEIKAEMVIPKAQTMEVLKEVTITESRIEEEQQPAIDMENLSMEELFRLLEGTLNDTPVQNEAVEENTSQNEKELESNIQKPAEEDFRKKLEALNSN